MKTTVMLLLLAAALLAEPTGAGAQGAGPNSVRQTFLSRAGSDAAPCSRAEPCATLAGALAKTDQGGIVTILDAGEYGSADAHVIGAVTIDASGVDATITLPPGGNPFFITTGAPSDIVTLRHLTFRGQGGAAVGISAGGTGQLIVALCRFEGFSGTAVQINNGQARLENTTLADSGVGLLAAGGATVSVTNCLLSGCGTALSAQAGATLHLAGNSFANNRTGIDTDKGGTIAPG